MEMQSKMSPVVEEEWAAPGAGDTGGSGSAIPGQDTAAMGEVWTEGRGRPTWNGSVGHG